MGLDKKGRLDFSIRDAMPEFADKPVESFEKPKKKFDRKPKDKGDK